MIKTVKKSARVYVIKKDVWTDMRDATIDWLNENKDEVEIINVQYLFHCDKWHSLITYWDLED